MTYKTFSLVLLFLMPGILMAQQPSAHLEAGREEAANGITVNTDVARTLIVSAAANDIEETSGPGHTGGGNAGIHHARGVKRHGWNICV